VTPIPFPLFEPDKSPFLFRAGDNLLNCIPVSDGWGPIPQSVVVSDALGGECLGGVAIKDTDNTLRIFAGTTQNLYRLNTSTSLYSWDEVSQTTDGYTVPSGDRWQFTLFGDSLIAHNLTNAIQVVDITTTNDFTDLGGSPPKAKLSAVVGDHVLLGWLENKPNAIRLSGVNDATDWGEGKRGAGEQELPDGGGVMGIVPVERGAYIVQRDKIRGLTLTSNSLLGFSVNVMNDARGAISSESIVQIGAGDFFYLSDEGFFRGVQGVPIGAERVDRWFFDTVDPDYLFDVRGFADPFRKIVWWRFRTTAGSARLIGYNWEQNRWCYSDQDNSHALRIITPGITIDGMDALFATIDDANVPFDSRLFKGGVPEFAIFTTDNELAFLSGGNAAATLRTAEIEMNPGQRTFVNGARIETDATTFTARVGKADYHGQTIAWDGSVSPSTRTKHLPFRSAGRLHQFEMSLAAGAEWSVVSNIRPEGTVEGQA
jgi:hypothetical protein